MQYAILRDYRFEGDMDDMRGSLLYGEGEKKIARLRDVVFDVNTGDIRYLIADCGYDRRVLVPLDRVSYVHEKHAFTSGITSPDLTQLPVFSEHVLESDEQWRNYEQLYRIVLDEQQPARSPATMIGGCGARNSKRAGIVRQVRHSLQNIRADAAARNSSKRRIA